MSVPAPPSSSDDPLDPGASTRTRTRSDGDDPVTTDLRARADRPLPAVPGFRVVRWLGGGGMGDVYEVVDEKHGVPFALKMVRADRVSPGFTARFHHEIRALMTLDHPHVVRIFRDGEAGGQPYFTMRFVRGGTLADRLPALRSDPRAAGRLLVKVVDAVEYLHRQGQVHRDLKPTNILIDEAGEPYLSDFGLVKDVADPVGPGDMVPVSPQPSSTDPNGETLTAPPAGDGRPHTRAGARLGTYAYMSPEQARGDLDRIGPATDVWALGVVLYECLTGRRPERDAPNPPPGIDPEIDRIVAKCLSADPAERYPSAALLAADLRAWLEPTPPPARRRAWVPAAIATAMLLAVVGATLAVLRPWRDDTPADWQTRARKDLRAGKTVTLVDADGNPAAGFRFVAGGGPAKAERDSGGWWAVHTPEAALAEFLDNPGVDDFLLTGEFRCPVLGGSPNIGLYAGRVAVPAATGNDWHYQLEYYFREHPGNVAPPGGRAPAPPPPARPKGGGPRVVGPVAKRVKGEVNGKREVRFHGSPFAGLGTTSAGERSWTIPADRVEVGGPWRKLAIRARGDVFAVAWDDGPEEPVTNPAADDQMKLQNRGGLGWPGPPLQFTARGGVGVYVEGGSAAVRNLTIGPP